MAVGMASEVAEDAPDVGLDDESEAVVVELVTPGASVPSVLATVDVPDDDAPASSLEAQPARRMTAAGTTAKAVFMAVSLPWRRSGGQIGLSRPATPRCPRERLS
jgi:hypothetical protein